MAGVLGAPPFVLGWDVASVVDAVGFGLTTVAGERIYGLTCYASAIMLPGGDAAALQLTSAIATTPSI